MQNTTLYIIYALIFVVVVMLVEGLYLLISDTSKNERIANKRMAMMANSPDDAPVLLLMQKYEGNALNKLFASFLPNLKRKLWAADVNLTVLGYFQLTIFIAVLFTVAFKVLAGLPFIAAIPAGLVLGLAGPFLFLSLKAARRQKQFSDQLCPAIDLVCRSLQAGHPAVVALEMVSREMPDPIGTEFGIAMDQTNYGMDRNQALMKVIERFPDPDLRFFVSALEIQRSTGANLVEILQNLTKVIRDRKGMRQKVKAMSAEGRFTAMVVGILPIGLAMVLALLNPGYYTDNGSDPLQIVLLIIPVILYVIGMVWLWRMVNIKI